MTLPLRRLPGEIARPLRQVQEPVVNATLSGGRQIRRTLESTRETALGAARDTVAETPRETMALVVGLGVAAAVSVIEWPVTLVVKTANAIARHNRASQR